MRAILLPSLILFFSSIPIHAAIWLKVGEIHVLPAPPDATVRVSSKGVVRAIDSAKGVQLIGLKPGASVVTINQRGVEVRVVRTGQKEFLRELRVALTSMLGLTLELEGERPEIHGTLLRLSDWRKLSEIAQRHRGDYLFRAQALADVAPAALAHLSGLAKARGLPVLRFTAEPEFTAHAPLGAASLRATVEDTFKPYGIAVKLDGSLALEPLVRTRVVLAEVSKAFSRDFGVQWPSEYRAQLLPNASGASANPEGLLATLRALEARGQAQILASPVLLCRSGGQAEFQAGGEFPIRMISRHGRDVMWKSHGVLMRVKPKADYQGAMSLEIETEVSILDMANAVDGVPALKINRVKSFFDLPGRRTVALSGLLRQELGDSHEGLPWLANLPVLGPLFSSQKFLKHQTELVVFVTPEVRAAESDEPVQMPVGWVADAK